MRVKDLRRLSDAARIDGSEENQRGFLFPLWSASFVLVDAIDLVCEIADGCDCVLDAEEICRAFCMSDERINEFCPECDRLRARAIAARLEAL
jgi:hypothetical protein